MWDHFIPRGEKILDVHCSMFVEALLLRALWYLNVCLNSFFCLCVIRFPDCLYV